MVCDDVYVITSPCPCADPESPLRASPSCRRETDWGVYYWCTIYSDTSVFRGQSAVLRYHNLDVLDLIVGVVCLSERRGAPDNQVFTLQSHRISTQESTTSPA